MDFGAHATHTASVSRKENGQSRVLSLWTTKSTDAQLTELFEKLVIKMAEKSQLDLCVVITINV